MEQKEKIEHIHQENKNMKKEVLYFFSSILEQHEKYLFTFLERSTVSRCKVSTKLP